MTCTLKRLDEVVRQGALSSRRSIDQGRAEVGRDSGDIMPDGPIICISVVAWKNMVHIIRRTYKLCRYDMPVMRRMRSIWIESRTFAPQFPVYFSKVGCPRLNFPRMSGFPLKHARSGAANQTQILTCTCTCTYLSYIYL